MSERRSTLFNKRACGLLIAGAFILLAIYLSLHSETPPPEAVPDAVSPEPPRRVDLTTPPVFDSASYYQTIIDNNLFRPLGWTPPRPTEPYRLLGTLLPRDANTPPKAIIQSTAGDRTYIVSTGDKIEALTEVVSIEGKQVTLETTGNKRTLRLETGVWLNPSRATRSTFRRKPATVRPLSVRSPGVALPVSRSSTRPASDSTHARPLSEWQTREGEVIRIGDARLKNPEKWGLRRR